MKVGYGESFVRKMLVKGEGFRDLPCFHDFETETVHQAYVSPVFAQETLCGPSVPHGVYPHYLQEWHYLCIEIMNWGQANTPLQKGYSFNEDIGTG
jgi:hypothetical protein